jgi:hypothetical protein
MSSQIYELILSVVEAGVILLAAAALIGIALGT